MAWLETSCKLAQPEEVRLTLSVTMPLWRWVQLDKILPDGEWQLKVAIQGVIKKATQEFSHREEINET